MNIDRAKSLNQLEHIQPTKPAYKSHAVSESHRLRDIPLSQLRVENLRLLIGQEIGLDYLVPVALDWLHQHPLGGADFYTGDLLVELLRLPPSFWFVRRDWRRRLDQIAKPVVERFVVSSHWKQEKFTLTFDSSTLAYEAFSRVQRATA